MTDLENRVWLCGEVMTVLREGGMSAERALAMLHRITDVKRIEPYLADPASTGDGWPDVSEFPTDLRRDDTQLTIHHSGDEIFGESLPVMPKIGELSCRTCAMCGEPLRRRQKETETQFEARETCSVSHAAQYREWQRRRDSDLAKFAQEKASCAVPT